MIVGDVAVEFFGEGVVSAVADVADVADVATKHLVRDREAAGHLKVVSSPQQ